MTVDVETYEGQVERLDVGYVRALGDELRARLFPRPNSEGVVPYPLPVEVVYEPGNGTRYDLVVVAARTLRRVSEESAVGGVPVDEEFVVVSQLNGGTFAATFDVGVGHAAHVSYVAERSGLGLADASALTALLRAVALAEIS